ncbi:GNAT family N-acetyltransferase [Butyrivibrio sp. VCB2006]|uniref:GNAT family N-acetyltransferase n=1 Tax=Butyrivibrio sp. VCB2006 TaxID=1280679 RepID=UPI000409BAA4|nr:GNAT family N-acetyltransferase [Butyrivibrio sp. VCB2006]
MLKNIIFSLKRSAIENKEVLGQVVRSGQYLEDCGYNVKLLEAEDESYPKIKSAGKKNTLIVCDSASYAKELTDKGYYCIGAIYSTNAGEKFEGLKYVFEEIEEVDADSFVKAYQRYSGDPWEVIRTDRLIIRETTVDDVDEFYRLYKEPEMTKYMEGLFENPEDEKRYQKDYIEKVYGLMGFGVWTIVRASDGEVIGRAGFSIRNGFENIELGFLIGKEYQGKGYAYEACSAILDYGRDVLCLEQVQALVKKENEVSINLCQKLGFECTDTVKVEENIYGHSYTGASDGTDIRVSESRYGEYLKFVKEL